MSGSENSLLLAAANPVTLDLMVVYTPAAVASLGGEDMTTLYIENRVQVMNLGYMQSEVPHRVRLVHSDLVHYVESGAGIAQDVGLLMGTTDPYMPEVHDLRDIHGADMVALLTHNPFTYCGSAYVMLAGQDSAWFADRAFAAFQTFSSCHLALGHELGHVMSLRHDRVEENVVGAGDTGLTVFPYSYGFINHPANFRTVMAYISNCSLGCPTVNRYSNPRVSYNGRATGIADPDPNSADNAQALSLIARVVNSFRPTVYPLTPPPAPQSLTASDGTFSDFVRITWDTVPEAENYILYRSESPEPETISWYKTVVGNSSFDDADVQVGALYYYWVKAQNTEGVSALTGGDSGYAL